MISSLFSRGRLDEKEDPRMWRISYKFSRIFEELTHDFGGINCSDIARVNWKDRETVRKFYRDPEGRRKHCTKLVGETALALGEILEGLEKAEQG